MSELRWILIAVGIVVIGGVYAWSRRNGSAGANSQNDRVEPNMGGLGLSPEPGAVGETGSVDEQVVAPPTPKATVEDPPNETERAEPEPEPMVADKIIKLHLVAKEDSPFNAGEIVAALRAEGLRFAHFDLFHRFAGEGNPGPDAKPQFSVSDMLKPGTFDLENLSDQSMRGVSLFLVLPNPGDAVAVFADMLATGRRLAATMGGQLVDNKGCTISRQSASHMREDIINYQLSLRKQSDTQEPAE